LHLKFFPREVTQHLVCVEVAPFRLLGLFHGFLGESVQRALALFELFLPSRGTLLPPELTYYVPLDLLRVVLIHLMVFEGRTELLLFDVVRMKHVIMKKL